jgi:hypothetical protein
MVCEGDALVKRLQRRKARSKKLHGLKTTREAITDRGLPYNATLLGSKAVARVLIPVTHWPLLAVILRLESMGNVTSCSTCISPQTRPSNLDHTGWGGHYMLFRKDEIFAS